MHVLNPVLGSPPQQLTAASPRESGLSCLVSARAHTHLQAASILHPRLGGGGGCPVIASPCALNPWSASLSLSPTHYVGSQRLSRNLTSYMGVGKAHLEKRRVIPYLGSQRESVTKVNFQHWKPRTKKGKEKVKGRTQLAPARYAKGELGSLVLSARSPHSAAGRAKMQSKRVKCLAWAAGAVDPPGRPREALFSLAGLARGCSLALRPACAGDLLRPAQLLEKDTLFNIGSFACNTAGGTAFSLSWQPVTCEEERV